MKKLFTTLLTIIFITGCSCTKIKDNVEKPVSIVLHDTITLYDTITIIDEDLIEVFREEIKILNDSIENMHKTVPFDNYMNARRIEKIKYYIRITEKNPTNKKFFWGWIKRTMVE